MEGESSVRENRQRACCDRHPTRRLSDRAPPCLLIPGGCFWGTELHFQRHEGVVATCVGGNDGRSHLWGGVRSFSSVH
jgi:hypothetical protein